METVGKEEVKEKEIEHKTCVVGFAIRVDKTKDTKEGFDKKLLEGLAFMQTYISFHLIRLGKAFKPIKAKGDMPKYQVMSRNYFYVPNARAFDNINADGGQMIKGSAIMGLTYNPEQCLEEAAGDLRTMGCMIYYKKCQEVDTVTSLILISIPNTIEEDVIKQTLDNELKHIKQSLLQNNKEYKLTREQISNWIKYAVVKDFPAGMPWEGTKEKKQKQGMCNSRLTYVLHMHRPDYKQLKYLLAYAKDSNVWDKIWGNTTYTIKTPEEKDPIRVKNKYIQMVQTHGSVQLSMGAATIEGMLNVDTVFKLRLLPDADGKARQPTKTTVKEIFSMMMINEHKVWICLSTGAKGMTTGYFYSIITAIKDHVSAFVLCPAAQVNWWLRHRGCLTEDVNCLIQHCFMLSQQQRVTKSKYLKDLGHAVINQTNANDIINAATTQGIYDLTLGLSDKEKWTMVLGRAHKASAIILWRGKERIYGSPQLLFGGIGHVNPFGEQEEAGCQNSCVSQKSS
jgi:hypothetical protein